MSHDRGGENHGDRHSDHHVHNEHHYGVRHGHHVLSDDHSHDDLDGSSLKFQYHDVQLRSGSILR